MLTNERLITLLYNSLVLLEENYDKEELLEKLGMTEAEYDAVVKGHTDNLCCTFGEKTDRGV